MSDDSLSPPPITSPTQYNPNDEMYISHSDSSNFMLATEKLNGDNFAQWKRSAEISLTAKNKIGFVYGTCVKPIGNSADLKQWERCNNLVMSWILHSVETSIASSVLYCKNACEIWNELHDRFAQSNAPRLYQLQKGVSSLEQGHRSISVYFTEFKTLWDEYLTMINISGCSCGIGSSFTQFIHNQQLLHFLMGLNDSFTTARGNILMMTPLPNLNQAYRLILQEEKQRDCHNESIVSHDSIALVSNSQKMSTQSFPNQTFKSDQYRGAGGGYVGQHNSGSQHHTYAVHHNSSNQNVFFGITPSGKKSKFFCTRCKVWGHSVDRCFKIHGYPSGSKQPFKGNKLAAAAHGCSSVQDGSHPSPQSGPAESPHQDPPITLSHHQYSELISLLKQQQFDNTSKLATTSSAFMAGPQSEGFSGTW